MSTPNTIEAALLDNVPAAVVVSDAGSRIFYCNRAARELYGCAPGETLPPQLALAVRNPGPWHGDVRVAGRRFHCRSAPVRDSASTLIGSITVSFEHGGNDDPALRDLGRRIARARAAAQMTQQELADALGVTRRSVQGYEAGKVGPYRHLDRLAEVLGCSKGWLLALDADLRRMVREELAATE
jgi:DNA-binding XRE family transcriptional regulator